MATCCICLMPECRLTFKLACRGGIFNPQCLVKYIHANFGGILTCPLCRSTKASPGMYIKLVRSINPSWGMPGLPPSFSWVSVEFPGTHVTGAFRGLQETDADAFIVIQPINGDDVPPVIPYPVRDLTKWRTHVDAAGITRSQLNPAAVRGVFPIDIVSTCETFGLFALSSIYAAYKLGFWNMVRLIDDTARGPIPFAALSGDQLTHFMSELASRYARTSPIFSWWQRSSRCLNLDPPDA